MKKLWNTIVNGIKRLFSRETVSKVWTILFSAGKSAIGSLLSDPEVMDAAFEFSKALVQRDGTAELKRQAFDQEMTDWAKSSGREIGTAALNAIRETAYAAVKAEQEQQA